MCSAKLFDEEEEEIREIAERIVPCIKLITVPHDLFGGGVGNKGVECLVEQIEELRA